MTPTYGNTLMGLAASRPVVPADGYTIAYYAPQPRAVIEVVDFDDRERGGARTVATGRVRLTTLTKETFIPGFPRARRGGARAALREVSLGRDQRRPSVP